jgi:ribosomal protein L34E
MSKKKKNEQKCAGCQWLMPTILTTHEAEIRKIEV